MSQNPRTTAAPDVVQVLVVDDHQLVRDGLRLLLSAQPDMEVVGEAATVEEAVRRAAYDDPDVVVLDVDLPDGSGIEACRRIVEIGPSTRVLMLTAYADPAALSDARAAGAAGFALKRIRDLELVDKIRLVAAGSSAFDDAPPPDHADPILTHLTRRELDILELVAEGRTNRDIADQLFLAEKTVKNYVSNLLAKMGFHHRSGAAAYLVEHRALTSHPYPPGDWSDI